MTEQPQSQQPPEPQITQPLVTFAATAPEPPQMPIQQPQPDLQPTSQMPASYQSIIDQQNEQIAALMAQNQALNGQITQMVQNGAQFAQQAPQQYQHAQPQQVQQFPNYYEPANPMQQFNPPSLALDQDVSLESLAEQIGKKE